MHYGFTEYVLPMPNNPKEHVPLCVENFDGKGVIKGIGRKLVAASAARANEAAVPNPAPTKSGKTKLAAKVVKVNGDDVVVEVATNLPVGAKLAVSLDFVFKINEGGPGGRGKMETVQSCYRSLKDKVTGPKTVLSFAATRTGSSSRSPVRCGPTRRSCGIRRPPRST